MRALRLIALLAWIAGSSLSGHSYSVLTHEQVVDLAWEDQIQPMLVERFRNSTPAELRRAHAFAYGGSVVEDMGYYPFGRKYFSDLVHYVRTGDFVCALVDDSRDLDEYAFALGALAHYSSDNMGHPTINQVVAIEFPKLRRKFGNEVTYADDHKTHIRTEFGFDMVQVAKNRYTSDRYHDFIGFEISKPLLERAFLKTYDLELAEVLGGSEDLAIGTFRRAVSRVVPAMTRVALLNRRADRVPERQDHAERRFLYRLSRTSYEKEWGNGYRRPGVGSRVLALILRIFPKVGPASALDFKIPSAQTEDLYIKSVNRTMDNYRLRLHQVREGRLRLANTDCDTGRDTHAAEYPLADDTYSRLLLDLARRRFANLTPGLRGNILSYYSNPNAPFHGKRNRKHWEETEQALEGLKNAPANSVARELGGEPARP
ncbi:MAG: zinc dependent phospholipase C family protein [Acidobacteria bacterium]|nr:zinc dependent phospholipase C family protein [Acidobacteriota bacterium]